MEPFFTVSRQANKGGTGLGLAIVRRIVQESRGYIHVESSPEQGTTFSLYFPLAERQITTSAPPSKIVGGVEHILVVDDETVQLRAAQRILKHLGYQVTAIQSGEAALDLFSRAENVLKFDLVIVDMLMPGLNGIETVEQLRRHRPDQKAIIASGYAPEKTSAEAQTKGMAWLAKPFTLQALAEAIRKALK